MAKILFVMTGATTGRWPTGPSTRPASGPRRLVAPYRAFTAAGHEVVVATPGGVVPAVDQGSLAPDVNGGQENADAIAAELGAIDQLGRPLQAGGRRPRRVRRGLLPRRPRPDGGPRRRRRPPASCSPRALDSGKPLGVVCHAPAALLAAADDDGASPFAGYRLTGFTNAEENQAGLADKAKWLLQDRLVALGADFQEGEPWAPHVVVDRNLYHRPEPGLVRSAGRRAPQGAGLR